ncbi:hypothetical protein V5799_006687 [Amblyomma americanum]|uniref:Secreted protein n=1 Tax=Amblyomma americanum TaxID=6943 RepID=A0AAQ4DVP5_AMBAM
MKTTTISALVVLLALANVLRADVDSDALFAEFCGLDSGARTSLLECLSQKSSEVKDAMQRSVNDAAGISKVLCDSDSFPEFILPLLEQLHPLATSCLESNQ